MQKAREFYDNFTKKLITDYLIDNSRMADAIRMTLSQIPSKSQKILDIGCGIGWSTHEMATHFPEAQVDGIDLSNNSIVAANTLFKLQNNSYSVVDVTADDFGNGMQFDAIVMIDVLEHIPLVERDRFINKIDTLLAHNGRFVLACPTVYHQNFLKAKGSGLQPVDEEIRLDDLLKIAQQLNGDIRYFEYKSIWHTNDYFHAVIEKNVDFKVVSGISTPKDCNLECIKTRLQRVKNSKYFELFNAEEQNQFESKKESMLSKIIRKLR